MDGWVDEWIQFILSWGSSISILLLLAEDYVRVWLSGDDGVLCKGKNKKKKEGIIGLPLLFSLLLSV